MEVPLSHTNHRPTFDGPVLRLGRRKRAEPTCRDEVLTAIANLNRREGLETFTMRQVALEMLAAETTYKQSAIYTTIKRMRGDGGSIEPDLERVDRTHFRLQPTSDQPAWVSSAQR